MRFWPRRAPAAAPEPAAPPAPERLTHVVGDIHGCAAPLDALLARIEADRGDADADLVFVGDYVDRGPDSAAVLDRLIALSGARPGRVHCLLGNHDRMLLDFLDAPDRGRRWLDLGGAATLASFGIGHVSAPSAAERLERMAAALRAALGPDREAWLRARPLWWRSGTLVAVHALTGPDRAMEDQDEATLLWARPGRDLRPRTDGAWVVHGHTILPEPRSLAGHVGIDTGAFRGGPLTAAVFDGGPVRFLSAASA